MWSFVCLLVFVIVVGVLLLFLVGFFGFLGGVCVWFFVFACLFLFGFLGLEGGFPELIRLQ